MEVIQAQQPGQFSRRNTSCDDLNLPEPKTDICKAANRLTRLTFASTVLPSGQT